jgi:hypothetical protein
MKPTILISSPYETHSGYGAHSRDLIRALLEYNEKHNLYDIYLLSLDWGMTPQTYFENASKYMIDLFNTHKITFDELYSGKIKIDLSISITIPNQFIVAGSQNIGITAGVETDRISKLWAGLLDSNKDMIQLVVPSQFTKDIFSKSLKQYDSKKIKVLFEGVDTGIFKKVNKIKHKKVIDIDKAIDEQFVYLITGQWTNINDSIDIDGRKNIKKSIELFLKTFSGMQNEIALAIKTNAGNFSHMDRLEVESVIKKQKQHFSYKNNISYDKLPNIYLIHANLTDEEMNELYNLKKIKAMISTTKGEGYGRPLAEFASIGKPVYVTGWSGHLDFITDNDYLFEYELKEVEDANVWDDIIERNSKWAYVNEIDVISKLTNSFFDYDKQKENFQHITNDIVENKNMSKMNELFIEYVKKIMPRNDIDLSVLNKTLEDKIKKMKRVK